MASDRKKKMQADRIKKFIEEGNLEVGESASLLQSAAKVKQRLAAKKNKKNILSTTVQRSKRRVSITGLAHQKKVKEEKEKEKKELEALEANTNRDELIGSLSKFGDGDGSYFDRWLGGNTTDTSSFSAGWITPLSGFKASPLAKKGAMAIMGGGGAVVTPVLDLRLKLAKQTREEQERDRVARMSNKERKSIEKEKQRKLRAEKKEFLRHMYGDLYVDEDEGELDDPDDDPDDEEQHVMDAKSTKEEKAQYLGGAEMRRQEMVNAEKIISKTYEFNSKQAGANMQDVDPEKMYKDTLSAIETSTYVGGRSSRHQFFACYKEEEHAYHKLSSSQSEVKLGNDIEAGVDEALNKMDKSHLEVKGSELDREKASQIAKKKKKSVVASTIGKEVEPPDSKEEEKEKQPPATPKATPKKAAQAKNVAKGAAKKGAKKAVEEKKGASESINPNPLGGSLQRFDAVQERTTFGLPSRQRPKTTGSRSSSKPSAQSRGCPPAVCPPIASAKGGGHTISEVRVRSESSSGNGEVVRAEAAEAMRKNEETEKTYNFGFGDATGGRSTFLDELRKQQLPPEPIILRQHQQASSGSDSTMRLNHLKIGSAYASCLSSALPSMLGRIRDLDLTDNRIKPATMIQLLEQFCPAVGTSVAIPCVLNSLNLSENKLTVGVVGTLVHLIHAQKKLKALNLAKCSLTERGGVLLMGAVYESSLEKLVLAHNNVGSMTGVRCADVLRDLWSLQELQLQWNDIRGQGAMAIARALAVNETITSLDLSWNGFGGNQGNGGSEDAAACVLGTSLRSNKTLRQLGLQYNNIGSRGFICLSSAIRHNNHLQAVALDGNRPSLEGFSSLIHTLNLLGGAADRVICCACSAGAIKEEMIMPKPKHKPVDVKKEEDPDVVKENTFEMPPPVWYRGRAAGEHSFDLADDYGWAAAQELLLLLATRPGYKLIKPEKGAPVKYKECMLLDTDVVLIKPEKGAPVKYHLERTGTFEDPESGEVVPSLHTYNLAELEKLGREGTLVCMVIKETSALAMLYESPILSAGGETLVKTAIRRWGEGFSFDRECFVRLVCGELYVESVVQQRLWFVVDVEAVKHEELQKAAVSLLASVAGVNVQQFGDTLHQDGSTSTMAKKRNHKFNIKKGEVSTRTICNVHTLFCKS
jgi:hypothetical protein